MHDKLGPYELLNLLGEGGMGQVYEARDSRDGSRVAVKLLRGGAAATEREKELFAREARVGMELRHPGLVRVLAVEIELSAQPYLVMEYLPGPTLKAALAQGPLDALHVVSLALPVVETLEYLHGQDVIHRDIKSGNLMLDDTGRPRVMDFGLTTFSDETSLSRTGIIFGSPHYMSPEQGLGETLDARSDLFSFGVVLFELLTGRLPFRGTHPLSVVYAIINEEPPPLRRILPELPAPLEWVLTKALAKSRDDRYSTAGGLAADLRQVTELLHGRVAEGDLALIAQPDRETMGEEQFPLPLVGREREIARIQGWLREPGDLSLLFLSGEAGVGKTRLVREALRRSGLEAPSALIGRTQPGREHFPYRPWLEALRPALRERELLDQDVLRELLDSASPGAGARAAVLWPFLGGDGAAPVESREQLFEALRSLLSALAGKEPLLIWLEDMHRTDRASLDLLAYFARCPAGELPPILLSFRDEELEDDAPLAKIIRELDGEGRSERMPLGRLAGEAVQRLVEDVLPDLAESERAAARLHAESRGNPFILRELLENIRRRSEERERLASDPEDWTLPLPARLLDLVSHRLGGLDSEEHELLELAAVEGEAFSAEVLASVLEQRKIHVLRRLQKLERRTRLVQAREGSFLFDHALVRRALYEGLGDEIRREYHLLIGGYLERSAAERPESAAAIARHFAGGGEMRRAVTYLLEAGRYARGLYAFHEARKHLEQARDEADLWWLEEPEGTARVLRLAILRELGLLEMAEGHYERAEQLFTGARGLLVPGLDEGRHAELDRLRGEALQYSGRNEDAAAAFQAALDHCPSGNRRETALILRSRAFLESKENRWEEALSSCEAALLLSENLPQEVSAIRHAMGIIKMSQGEFAEARRLFEEVVARATSEEEQYLHTAALANLGNVLWQQGESEQALVCMERSLELRRRLGLVIEYAQILTNLAIIHIRTGPLEKARRLLGEARELKERIGDAVGLASTENSLGSLEERAGRLPVAVEHFRNAIRLHFEGHNRARAAVALNNLGEVLLDMGRVEEATEHLEHAFEIREELGLRGALISSLRTRGRYLAALGQSRRAEKSFAEAKHMAEAEGLKKDAFQVELYRLRFLLGVGRGEEALRDLELYRSEYPEGPPAGYDFDLRLLEASLLSDGERPSEAKAVLIRLLDEQPADREPYRRALVLRVLAGREWPDLEDVLRESWRSELQSLIAAGGYDWLI